MNFSEMEKKIKSLPHWREDFKLKLEKVVDGLPVWSVEADDQSPETIKRIAQLNMELKKG